MSYAIPDRLPWDVFAAAWERAEEALARLDQTLAVSDLKEAWTGRAHFVALTLNLRLPFVLNQHVGGFTDFETLTLI